MKRIGLRNTSSAVLFLAGTIAAVGAFAQPPQGGYGPGYGMGPGMMVAPAPDTDKVPATDRAPGWVRAGWMATALDTVKVRALAWTRA